MTRIKRKERVMINNKKTVMIIYMVSALTRELFWKRSLLSHWEK